MGNKILFFVVFLLAIETNFHIKNFEIKKLSKKISKLLNVYLGRGIIPPYMGGDLPLP
jgi:hypothetical protein